MAIRIFNIFLNKILLILITNPLAAKFFESKTRIFRQIQPPQVSTCHPLQAYTSASLYFGAIWGKTGRFGAIWVRFSPYCTQCTSSRSIGVLHINEKGIKFSIVPSGYLFLFGIICRIHHGN